MLGLIILAAERGCGLSANGLLEPVLGVPLLARSIAAALPAHEAVTAVVVVPPHLVERVQTEVVERFGFDEVRHVIAGGSDRHAALGAALAVLCGDTDDGTRHDLPEPIELVIVQEGARPLVPTGLVERVVAAAREGDGAVPVVAPHDAVVMDVDGTYRHEPVGAHAKLVQGPACFRVDRLRTAMPHHADGISEADLMCRMDARIRLVNGDDDNLLLRDVADVGRALEVVSRRASDLAFIYPRDLPPDDPLARALDGATDVHGAFPHARREEAEGTRAQKDDNASEAAVPPAARRAESEA